LKLRHDHRIVAHHPGIVSSGSEDGVAGTRLVLGAVLELRRQSAENDEGDMRLLAPFGPDKRFDRLGPAPSRLELEPADHGVPNVGDIDLALVEYACFIWRLEVLTDDLLASSGPFGHVQPPHIENGWAPYAVRTDVPSGQSNI
jgi:hypothetical protein